MLESILKSTTELSIINLLFCSLFSIILGLIISLVHKYTSHYTKNFLITLAILPILVQSIILMVNGNLGTSIAIVGAFSLVRFRSIPGTSKEIVSVIFAMTIGLATGMGHVLFASIITLLVSLVLIVLSKTNFGRRKETQKILKITLPDDLNYTEVFNDIFKKYVNEYTIEKVKTVNLGSLFEITYHLEMKEDINEKEFIDELRCKNGNLKIILTYPIESNEL
ncbi:MAG: DUF4956 domain-containing protein [Bacilli bacterium]|nr:DUF4956 domain-containing protein [Bacilli bacterium]